MRLPLIQVDKYVTDPYTPSDTSKFPFPADPLQYFTVQIQVYEDDGTHPTAPVSIYLGDRMTANRIQYWYDDTAKTNFTAKVWLGDEIPTDASGYIKFYLGVSNSGDTQYPGCIFDLFANLTNPNPGRRLQTGLSQTLTCCYTDFTNASRTGTLTSLVLSSAEDNMVAIPKWGTFQFSTSVMLKSLDAKINPDARLTIVVNGKRADVGSDQYQALLTGVDIPYQLMIYDPTQNNLNMIHYIVDDGIPRTSIPAQFPIDGVPLIMPNVDRQQVATAPWWYNAEEGQPPSNQPLTMADLISNDNLGRGLFIKFKLQPKVKPGDTYWIHVYLNGFKDNLPRTQVLGDGSSLAAVDGVGDNRLPYVVQDGDEAGAVRYVKVFLNTVKFFGAKDFKDPGYMWFDYQINGREWSQAYVGNYSPVLIDLEDVPPTSKQKSTKP